MGTHRKMTREEEYRLMQMGLNLAYYRKLAGMTQEELAQCCGLSRITISAIKAPNMVYSCSLLTLLRVAEALGTEAANLLRFA